MILFPIQCPALRFYFAGLRKMSCLIFSGMCSRLWYREMMSHGGESIGPGVRQLGFKYMVTWLLYYLSQVTYPSMSHFPYLWWLNLYINLIRPRHCIVLGVSMRMFLNEIAIWIGRLSPADCFPPIWVSFIRSVESMNKTKGWIRGLHSSLTDCL